MPVVINGTTGIVSPKVNTLDLELDSKNVVERGSNANGEYVRFADGTQICTGQLTGPYAAGVNSLIGVPWTFPAAFSSSDYAISSYGAPANTNDLFGMVSYANNTPSSIIANYRNGSTAQNITLVKFSAIGRWY